MDLVGVEKKSKDMADIRRLAYHDTSLLLRLSLTKGSILTSPIFDFVIGPTRTKVSVHSGLLERFSPPLWNMMNAGMKEAKDRVAELPDVELDVFLAAIEFAIIGDYSPPQSTVEEPQHYPDKSSSIALVTTYEEETNEGGTHGWKQEWGQKWDSDFCKPKNRKKWDYCEVDDSSSSKQNIWNRFKSLSFLGPKSGNKTSPQPSATIFHAELYCFAEEKMMKTLQDVCLHHLHQDLVNFMLDPNDNAEIMALLELVYTRTSRQCIDPPNRLRNLVICYVASQALVLKRDQGFRTLLDEHAEIGSDLVDQLVD